MLEVGKVKPSPTSNIQETIPCGPTILVNEGGELFRFSPIIFHGEVDGIVILSCLGKHGSPLLPLASDTNSPHTVHYSQHYPSARIGHLPDLRSRIGHEH